MAITLEDVLGKRIPTISGVPPQEDLTTPDPIVDTWIKEKQAGDTSALHQYTINAAQKRSLDPHYALAMIQQESSFNPSALGQGGERGLGQFTKGTADSRKLDWEKLRTDPQYNIDSSLDYLKELKDKSGGDIRQGLIRYNGGGDPNYLTNVESHLPQMRQIAQNIPPQTPSLASRFATGVVTQLGKMGEQEVANAPGRIASAIGTGEAALSLGTGLIGGTLGATEFVSKALMDIGGPEQPHYWDNLVKGVQKTAREFSYEPKTEEGRRITSAISTPLEVIHKMSEGASEAPLSRMLFTEDQRKAVAYAHELVTMVALGEFAGAATSSMRGTTARFKSEFVKVAKEGTTQSEPLLRAAEEVVRKAESVPEWNDRVTRLRELQQQDAMGPLDEWLGREKAPETPTTPITPEAPISVPQSQAPIEIGSSISPEAQRANAANAAKIAELESRAELVRQTIKESQTPAIEPTISVDQRVLDAQKKLANAQIARRYTGRSGGTRNELGVEPVRQKLLAAQDELQNALEARDAATEQQPLRSYRSERYSKVSPEERANYELGIEDAGKQLEQNSTKPTTLSAEQKIAYAQERANTFGEITRPPGETTDPIIARVQKAIEEGNKNFGDEISKELPGAVRGEIAKMKYDEAFALARKGIEGSESRGVMDIIRDISDLFSFDINPSSTGIIGGQVSISYAQKMAAQRLAADAARAGRTLDDYLRERRIPEEMIKIFTDYLGQVPPIIPPTANVPRNMPLDSKAMPGGNDPVVKHRVKDNGLTAAPLRESEVRTLQEAPVREDHPGRVGLEVPIRSIEKFGQDVKELTYYAGRDAKDATSKEVKVMREDLQQLSRDLKYSEKRNLENYMDDLSNDRPKGVVLSAKEQKVVASLKDGITQYYDRAQEIRKATGFDPLPPMEDPLLFMRSLVAAKRLREGINIATIPVEQFDSVYKVNKNAPLPTTLTQKALGMANRVDPLRIFDEFATSTADQLHQAPVVAKLKEMSNSQLPDLATKLPENLAQGAFETPFPKYAKKFQLSETNPGLYDFISRFANTLEGKPESRLGKIGNLDLDGVINKLRENLTWGLLSFGTKSAISQPASLINTWYSAGGINTMKAVGTEMAGVFGKNSWRQELIDNSHVLSSRADLSIYGDWTEALTRGSLKDAIQAVREGRTRDFIGQGANLGIIPLEVMDYESAIITGHAFRIKGESLGLKGKDLWNFVDDGITKTQGSGWRGDLSPIQRTALGKALTQFGTFTISDLNFLVNDVLKPAKGESTLSVLKNVARLVAITSAYNTIMEDFFNINSPAPTPIRDAMKTAQSGGDPLAVATSFAFGLLGPYAPGIGSIRYGKGAGGPVITKATELAGALQGRPGAVNPLEPLSELAGVPGSGFMWRMHRAKDTQSIWDSLMGNPPPPSSPGSSGGLSSGLKGGMKGGLKGSLK